MFIFNISKYVKKYSFETLMNNILFKNIKINFICMYIFN